MPVINTTSANTNGPRTPRTPPPSYALSTSSTSTSTSRPSPAFSNTTANTPSASTSTRPTRPKLTLRLDSIPEYAPLSIVKPYTPSHSTYPYNNNPSSNPSSHSTYPYNPYTPSSSSYPSFTLNLGVEESPLGALTPLTPLTPRTPGGRWFDPFPGQGQGQDSERDGTLDERDNGIDVVDGIQGSTMRKGKRKQKENTENDKEYVDGDCGICFEEAVRPTLTPCCARVFCAEHLDEIGGLLARQIVGSVDRWLGG